jgi:hypothetical protein
MRRRLVGGYYLIVNPAKRECLDPARFGEGTKFHNLLGGGHSSLALKYLISDSGPGWWVGDPVILAADDTGPPNLAGLVTTTPTAPHRNLYFQAREEFTDISYRALDLICHSQTVAADLALLATRFNRLLLDLGTALDQYGLRPLELALEQAVGRPWRKAYNIAAAESPDWRPLPRVDWPKPANSGAAHSAMRTESGSD